jgi:hypothetical protein
MSRILVIDDISKKRIESLITIARKNVIPMDQVVRQTPVVDGEVLTQSDLESVDRPVASGIDIPYGFHVCFSIEHQPAGMVHHISVSIDTPGKCPSEAAVFMLAQEFGMEAPFDRIWLEEFEPGQHAVNIIKIVTPTTAGHA